MSLASPLRFVRSLRFHGPHGGLGLFSRENDNPTEENTALRNHRAKKSQIGLNYERRRKIDLGMAEGRGNKRKDGGDTMASSEVLFSFEKTTSVVIL